MSLCPQMGRVDPNQIKSGRRGTPLDEAAEVLKADEGKDATAHMRAKQVMMLHNWQKLSRSRG